MESSCATSPNPPLLVIWELTQARGLACKYCWGSARRERDPGELSYEEARLLLRKIREFGTPLLILTGGDPLKRPDLFGLLKTSVAIGLGTTITPSATPLLTEEAVSRIQECGVAHMALSLDGACATDHDRFRQVTGSFDRTIAAMRHAAKIGLETQINTTRHNLATLDHIASLVGEEKAGCGAFSSWASPGGRN